MSRHAGCLLPVSVDNRPKRLPVSIRLDPTAKLPVAVVNRPQRLPVSIRLDPTSKLPVAVDKGPKRLPVSIRLNPTAVIIAQVKDEVSELKTEMAKESAARKELNVCVEQLKIDAAVAKQYFMDVPNQNVSQKTLHLLMKRLPCKSLEELNWLLAYIANRSLQWVEFIKVLGGTDFNSALKSIINTVMDRSVQKQLSWTGLKNKKASLKFKYKGIVDGIHVAMTDQFKDYTIVRGEAKMQSLLQNAARKN